MNRKNLSGLIALFILVGLFTEVSTVTAQQSGLVAYWKFDEGSGSTAFDTSGYGNTGTLSGGPTWITDQTQCKIDSCLSFDGVDDSVGIGQPSILDLTQQITIEAWVKRDSLKDGSIVAKNGPYYLGISGNKVEGRVLANTWGSVSGTTDLITGIWYKLAMSYDGDTLNVYVDGTLEGMVSKTGTMPYTG
jgi:hypothetical protein